MTCLSREKKAVINDTLRDILVLKKYSGRVSASQPFGCHSPPALYEVRVSPEGAKHRWSGLQSICCAQHCATLMVIRRALLMLCERDFCKQCAFSVFGPLVDLHWFK